MKTDLVAQSDTITVHNPGQYGAAGAMLLDLKRMEKKVKATFAETVTAANQAHSKALEAQAKHLDPVLDAIAHVKHLMVQWAIVYSDEPPAVKGVTMRDAWEVEVEDASVLPREYMSPDRAKIRKVVVGMDGNVKIPGVTFRRTKNLAVRG